MSYYRLYFMYPGTTHIDAVVEIDARHDAAALHAASAHQGWQPLELWCGSRKVKRLDIKMIDAIPYNGRAASYPA